MDPKLMILLVFCLIGAALAGYIQSPSGRGTIGELIVRIIIGKTKEGKKYVLNNYMLVYEGKSSQIDHIVINKNGIFVIETKNYSGRIYGNENQQEWTQVLSYGKVKHKFYSPIKQNATHIYRLSRIINQSIEIKSLIVFVQSNTKYINATNVIPLYKLGKTINISGKNTLTKEQMKSLFEILTAAKANKDISIRDHVKEINKMKQNIEEGICPRCDGKLVERKGKYGEFLGCENYPKCKFIKK